VTEAQARAYQAVDRVRWPDGFCRRDIAWQAVALERVDRGEPNGDNGPRVPS
jgi:phosphoribosylamine-glycine ligase